MVQVSLQQQALSKRKTRSPSHPFYVRHRPFQIQPFFFAPVLAGETLKNLTIQARAVTDPIINPIIGWWLEHYVFYVKLRDLYGRDDFTNMLMSPGYSMAAYDAATDHKYMHYNAGTETPLINWVSLCAARCVDEYFRNEGEVSSDYLINTLPAAALNYTDALQSAIKDSDWNAASNVDVDVLPGADGNRSTLYTSEIDKYMQQYHTAIAMRLTDMTFEDYLAQFGVKIPKEELLRPELVRYSRDWQYPSNTIDPSNGVPRSAVSWSIAERADKDRYFKEPGFLIGLTCSRAKMYPKYKGNPSEFMNQALRWFPPMLTNEPTAGWVQMDGADDPVANVLSNTAWDFDMKDYLLHGYPFVNFDPSGNLSSPQVSNGLYNQASVPFAATHASGTGVVYYPVVADVDNLFVDTTTGNGGLRQDGVVQAHILGRQVETSPVGIGTNKTV